MRKTILILIIQLIVLNAIGQEKFVYRIYSATGKRVSYGKMIKSLAKSDIILFGEYHNNPISHWLERSVTEDLGKTQKLILGAEMFEADNQEPLNQYLAGKISSKELDSLARLWPNYKDYAPLVDYAKEKQLRFIATNIPRKYAKLVNNKGFEGLDTLTIEEKSWIAPLPFPYDSELPGYKGMLEMMGVHGSQNMPKAQAVKDATMAHFILRNYNTGETFIHYNGTYHSDNFEGIFWYLKQQNPGMNYKTISTVSQNDVTKLENENINKADFIICIDSKMTTSY